jgi:hypothetical protein
MQPDKPTAMAASACCGVGRLPHPRISAPASSAGPQGCGSSAGPQRWTAGRCISIWFTRPCSHGGEQDLSSTRHGSTLGSNPTAQSPLAHCDPSSRLLVGTDHISSAGHWRCACKPLTLPRVAAIQWWAPELPAELSQYGCSVRLSTCLVPASYMPRTCPSGPRTSLVPASYTAGTYQPRTCPSGPEGPFST